MTDVFSHKRIGQANEATSSDLQKPHSSDASGKTNTSLQGTSPAWVCGACITHKALGSSSIADEGGAWRSERCDAATNVLDQAICADKSRQESGHQTIVARAPTLS